MQDLEFRQLVERIKLRSPIEVVVGDRVQGLRAQGALWWARCPFHQERTPSFAVDPRKGTWRCYGACSEGGDVLSFVQRFDGVPFLDALRLLARAAGEELPERSLSRRSTGADRALEERFELLAWAGELYRKNLETPGAARARAYLSGRGLEPRTQERFGVGWAPEEGSLLCAAAQREKRSIELLVELGLARRGQDGRPYDFFRGRIQIPIRDRLARIVGFGGRVLAESSRPGDRPVAKYVNTQETSFFRKGRLIYALDLAAEEVRRSKHLLLVEGYTDVMAAHQAGWPNTAAILGTATTDEHAALIRRTGARRVTLVFDGDEAGRRANLKALSALVRLPLELRIATLPAGRDPGDLLVSADGAREFRERIESAVEWFTWCLEGLAGVRGAELSAVLEERFELLNRLENAVERSQRLTEMARTLALPESDVRAQWQVFARKTRVLPAPETALATPRSPVRAADPKSAQLEQAFELLIGALLLDNSLVPLHAPLVEACPEGDLATIFRALLELYERDQSDQPIDADRVITALGDHPARELVVALELRAETAENAETLARDQALWIQHRQRESELRTLRGELAASVRSFEEATQRDLLEKLHEKLRAGRVPAAAPTPCSPSS